MVGWLVLKYATSPDPAKAAPLSQHEDKYVRLAFGRYAKEQFRKAGEQIVAYHYKYERRFHCDCGPKDGRPPQLFLVEGRFIRREPDDAGTPHKDECDFFKDAVEQNNVISSYQYKKPSRILNLLPNFKDDTDYAPIAAGTDRSSQNEDRSKLAKIMMHLLHQGGLDIMPQDGILKNDDPREHYRQDDALKEAARGLMITSSRKLIDYMALSLNGYYRLIKNLQSEIHMKERAQGVLIEVFERIEDNVLYPQKGEAIPVAGKLSVFGEHISLHRGPYLVIGLLGQPDKYSDKIEMIKAYAHPCAYWTRFMLVDSKLERRTLEILIKLRDRLKDEFHVTMTIEKPLHDVGPTLNNEPREVCIPDFILRARGEEVKHRMIVIETMGYNDPEYRERKQRMRPYFEHIYDSRYAVPVIEHDSHIVGLDKTQIDHKFMGDVINTILNK